MPCTGVIEQRGRAANQEVAPGRKFPGEDGPQFAARNVR